MMASAIITVVPATLPKAPKATTKTHRRSRTGCFTCRLRRKKCNEEKPCCLACKNLGLTCEYKRPVWWTNIDQRKRQKELIKSSIKRTKLTEKAAHLTSPPNSIDSPPDLTHSMPTSDTLSESLARHRSVSIDSQYSQYDSGLHFQTPHHYVSQQEQQHYPGPYDYDVVQKETYVNGFPVPTPRRSSSSASYASSNMRRPSIVEQPFFSHHVTIPESISPEEYFDINQFAPSPTMVYIPVEGGDRQLLDHFIQEVQRHLFPILDLHGSARQDLIMPALVNNECYRNCSLSFAALHLKTTQHLAGANAECADHDIMRHRHKTIQGLCEALARDSDHLKILEATLGMILFQCSVGSPDDSLPDIPWHHHFQAVISLVNKLDLTCYLHPIGRSSSLSPTLNMTLTAWIDILGATMLGRAPQFADTYREKHLSAASSGLRELMGCEDRVMYLISEIACLEALKNQDMLTDMDLCTHIESLAHQIDMTEDAMPPTVQPPVIQSGHVDPRALTNQMTAAFRCAARIYLCSLVPGFDRTQPQIVQLLEKLTAVLEGIPAGPNGFDSSLVWVMLIAGGVAGPDSGFRAFFEQRCELLCEQAEFASFGRMRVVLEEVWRVRQCGGEVTWRDVMRTENWEYLLL